MESNIVPFGLPIEIFEVFLQYKYGEVTLEYNGQKIIIPLDAFILEEYYYRFYTSQIVGVNSSGNDSYVIPMYANIYTCKALSIKEVDEAGLLTSVESDVVYFDFGDGKGEVETEILNIERNLLEDHLFDEKGFSINSIFGSVYFSKDFIAITLSNREFIGINNLPFLIKNDCSIGGVLIEPNFEEGANVTLVCV